MFKDITYDINTPALKVKIESKAQELHATFFDADLNFHDADKAMRDRLNMLEQQLQHQINVKQQFEGICPCLRHNLSPPSKINSCQCRHVCRCVHLIIKCQTNVVQIITRIIENSVKN